MSLESFNYKGKEIQFWEITGEVMSSSKHSETQVWSSGGGGSVGPQGGYVAAATVHSKAITNHEFWLLTADGKEKVIQLKDVDIPIREGQKITLIAAQEKDSETAYYSVLVNHNAEKYYIIQSAEKLNELFKIFTGFMSFKGFFIVFLISLLISFTSDHPFELFFWLFFPGWFLGEMMRGSFHKNFFPALNLHLKKLAQQALI